MSFSLGFVCLILKTILKYHDFHDLCQIYHFKLLLKSKTVFISWYFFQYCYYLHVQILQQN